MPRSFVGTKSHVSFAAPSIASTAPAALGRPVK